MKRQQGKEEQQGWRREDSKVKTSSKDGGEKTDNEQDGQTKVGEEQGWQEGRREHCKIGKSTKKIGGENQNDGEDKKKPDDMKDQHTEMQMKG